MDINNIVQFILNPEPSFWFILVKVLFLLINLSMISFIVYAILKTSWLDKLLLHDVQEFLTYKHYGLSKTKKIWEEIEAYFKKGTEPEIKLAIVEADSLLDNILRVMSYEGKDLGSKLDGINTNILENLEDVKKYHKIYLNIVHDPTYRLDYKTAEDALKVYREALVNLDAL